MTVSNIVRAEQTSPGQHTNCPQSPVKPKKKMVSYDVFMKYVQLDDTNTIDVSKIFSEECFHEWIANRKKRPKEPEESFRKALVAHVSGKDDRKPFPPQVELQILLRLRESEPWPCFQNSDHSAHKIGERGLKKSSLGYHESKRKREIEEHESNSRSGSRPALSTPMNAQHFPPVSTDMSPLPFAIPMDSYSAGMKNFSPLMNPFMPGTGYPELNLGNLGSFPAVRFSNYGYGPQQLPGLLNQDIPFNAFAEEMKFKKEESAHSAFKEFVNIILRRDQLPSHKNSKALASCLSVFYSVDELKTLFEMKFSDGTSLITDEICQQMDNVESHPSPFAKEEFLSPNAKDSHFKENEPIGQMSVTVLGYIFVLDENSESLIGKPLLGTNFFEMFISPLQRGLVLRYILVGVKESNNCWVRVITSSLKAPKVLLFHVTLDARRTLICRFQDVSKDFQSSLDSQQLLG